MFSLENQNKYYLGLLSQFRSKYSGKSSTERSEIIIRMILDESDLPNESRQTLAVLLIAEDFRQSRKEGMIITVSDQCQYFIDLFQQNGFDLDLILLQKYLIQVDIETTEHKLTPQSQIELYPHLESFINEIFDKDKTLLLSRFHNLEKEEATETENDFIHSNDDHVQMSEDYRILRHIKTGGEKVVYEVEQISTHQHLALKELRSTNAGKIRARNNILDEATLLARLNHPNIPAVFSLKRSETDVPVFVERLIRGTNWEQIMSQRSFDENLSTLLTVSQIIAYAHEQHHIIHGDLKPENIMLGESEGKYNEIHVTDWGFAIYIDKDQTGHNLYYGGTISYMPPESLLEPAIPASTATDVFMLGGILYRILAGCAPYEEVYYLQGITIASEHVANTIIPPIPEINEISHQPNPVELIQIAWKALSRDPKDRYQNAGEFAESLRQYLHQAALSRRLLAASNDYQQLQSKISLAPNRKKMNPDESFLMELIETTNEFRLIRQEAAGSNDPARQQSDLSSSLLQRSIESETDARHLLLQLAIVSKDYSFAKAQLQIAMDLDQKYRKKEGSADPEPSILHQIEKDLEHGLAVQRRDRFMKWLAGFTTLAVFLVLILVFIQRARNITYESKIAIQEKENRILQIVPLELGVATARQESFGPALMQYYNAIRQISTDDPLLPSKMEEVRQNYFFPQGLTEPSKGLIRSPKIDEIVFSKKGDQFALLASTTGEIWIWDTSTVKVVGKNRFSPKPGVQYTLRTNPLFEKGYNWEKGTTRPFMLVTSSGYLAYVGSDTRSQTNPEMGIVDLLTGKELEDESKYKSLMCIFKVSIRKKIIIRNEIRDPNMDFLDISDRKEAIPWKKFFDHQNTTAFLKKMDLSPVNPDFDKTKTGDPIPAMCPISQIRIEIHKDILSHFDLTSGRRMNKSLVLDDPFRPQPKGVVQRDADRLIVWDGSLRSIEPESLQTDRLFAESDNVCTVLLAQNGGSRFAAAFENGDLAIYDTAQEKPLRRFSALFPPCSRILLGSDSKGTTFVAATSTSKEIFRID